MLRKKTAAAVLALLCSSPLAAQEAPKPGDRAVTVVPGPEYEAGSFTRALLGSGWRDLWTTPIQVPVFDMSRFAGGVKPVERGGGNQTLTLRFVEVDGWREYLFRSVDKFPVGQAMPAAIRGTTVGGIIQDQVSTLLPAGALLVPPFLEAAGILHVAPQLYVMPDDPRLGDFRKEYAGLLGTIELSPQEAPKDQPGFGGSTKISGGEGFLEDVGKTREHHLDERELFAVRLIDFLVNDNDRTADNMRFARYGKDGAYTWRPLPRDRDRAFVDARGALTKFVIRPFYPKLIEFSPRYDLNGLTFESHNLDRRLLQRLTRRDADDVALRVRNAITDKVIEDAIVALPTAWRTSTDAPARLRNTLRARRDALPSIAREFYDWLATEVDVHGTDQNERANVERHADGSVTVTLRGVKDEAADQPFSTRTFLPSETNEVRVYLHGGDDIARVAGSSSDAIIVRVIGGDGDDALEDAAGGGGTRFYDEKGKNKFITRGTRVSERDWVVPRQGAGVRFDAPWRPDWGKSTGWGPAFDYVDGGGLVVGFGPRYLSYGFRRLPYKVKASADVLLALGSRLPGVRTSVDYRFENSPLAMIFAARGTRYEAFRFHGFGNDTDRQRRAVALVDQDLIAVEPMLVHHIGWRSRENLGSGFGKDEKKEEGKKEEKSESGLRPLIGKLQAGPVFLWSKAHAAAGSPFALEGMRTVGRVGGQVGLELDRTSNETPSTSGWTLKSELAGYPPLLDIEESFATATAVAATYLPLMHDATHLAFRAGGTAATGGYPVQHAATIGGGSTVRGYSSRRFTGDRAAFGSAEVRVPVGTLPLLVRWNTGVFGLADAGRVWYHGDSPGGWHAGFGGGLWLSSLGQTFSVAYAHGDENRFYLQKGMFF